MQCALCPNCTFGDDASIGLQAVCGDCARSIARQIGYVRYEDYESPEFEPVAALSSPANVSSAPPPPAEPSPEGSA